jgi:hypothetical protein
VLSPGVLSADGTVDWDAVMAIMPRLEHVEWALVEQEHTDREPGESLRISRFRL